jgi:hypothetical protein
VKELLIRYRGDVVVYIDADGHAHPAEGVTAEQLAKILADVMESRERTEARHRQERDDLFELLNAVVRRAGGKEQR